jgi:hypothetical protein
LRPGPVGGGQGVGQRPGAVAGGVEVDGNVEHQRLRRRVAGGELLQRLRQPAVDVAPGRPGEVGQYRLAHPVVRVVPRLALAHARRGDQPAGVQQVAGAGRDAPQARSSTHLRHPQRPAGDGHHLQQGTRLRGKPLDPGPEHLIQGRRRVALAGAGVLGQLVNKEGATSRLVRDAFGRPAPLPQQGLVSGGACW